MVEGLSKWRSQARRRANGVPQQNIASAPPEVADADVLMRRASAPEWHVHVRGLVEDDVLLQASVNARIGSGRDAARQEPPRSPVKIAVVRARRYLQSTRLPDIELKPTPPQKPRWTKARLMSAAVSALSPKPRPAARRWAARAAEGQKACDAGRSPVHSSPMRSPFQGRSWSRSRTTAGTTAADADGGAPSPARAPADGVSLGNFMKIKAPHLLSPHRRGTSSLPKATTG